MPTSKKRKISVTIDEAYMLLVDAQANEEERKHSQILEFALRDYYAKKGKISPSHESHKVVKTKK